MWRVSGTAPVQNFILPLEGAIYAVPKGIHSFAKEADGVSTPGMKERFLTNTVRKSAGHQTRVTAR